ncbi:Uncharacterised protein [Salmonella enterica]|nr:Uncharacterised protein [Salmonella enterica]
MAWFCGVAVGTLCYLNCQANPGVQRGGTFLVAEIISFVFGVMARRGIV